MLIIVTFYMNLQISTMRKRYGSHFFSKCAFLIKKYLHRISSDAGIFRIIDNDESVLKIEQLTENGFLFTIRFAVAIIIMPATVTIPILGI